MSAMMDASLAYAALGWHVFPLLERDKRPRFAGAYKRATTDPAQIRRWWRQWPDANIGLATGAVSGLWVLDVDGELGEQSWVELVRPWGGAPETRMVATSKGYHLYWRLGSAADPGRRIGVRPGLDVIGGQGYLLAPPSVHPSGRTYDWMDDQAELVEAPTWMLQTLMARTEAPRPARFVASSSPARQIAGAVARAQRDIAAAGEGQRNRELFRAAVWVAQVASQSGLDASSAVGELWAAAQRTGLDDVEIRRTLESALRKGRTA
jgi:hypothetical protein